MLNSQLTEHLGARLAPLQPLWRSTPLAPSHPSSPPLTSLVAGAMNGFALSVSSLARASAPVLCGSLSAASTPQTQRLAKCLPPARLTRATAPPYRRSFSAGAARGESPLEGLPFYLLGALSLGGLALSSYLPPRAVEAPGGAPPVGYDVCR